MASDRGVGLVAGYREAHPEALWVSDQFHEFHDLFNLRSPWERKAYGAIAQQDAAARKFHHAKSESNLHKRLLQYEQAHQACEQAMARYDQLDTLLQLLQEALQLCTSQGKLRTKAGVSSELTSLFHIPPDLVVAEGVPDGESSSHRDFLFLHDVGTTSNQLSSHKITSAISRA
jgi:hypothetical protein